LTANLALTWGCLAAIGVIAYAAAFELWADMVVVAWAILALLAFGLAAFVRRDALAWLAACVGGSALLTVAGLVALGIVAPPTRLVVAPHFNGAVPLVAGMTLALPALAVLAAALAVAGWIVARWPSTQSSGRRRANLLSAWAVAAAGAVAVYLISIATIDLFQGRVGSSTPSEEIATQAQVVLSIVWVLIGAGAFALGLMRRISLARMFGLGLLSLATCKVFLFDLASLEVAYRVLSFIGLGGVLLASSFVAARFRARDVQQDSSSE
jgi:uncharacterized membrane protein